MGEVSYIYYLSPTDYIIVNFFNQGKKVKGFLINYVSIIKGVEVTIRRYDNRHGKPHLDRFKNPIFKKTSKNKYQLKNVEKTKTWLDDNEGKIMRQGRDNIITNWIKYKKEYINSIIYK